MYERPLLESEPKPPSFDPPENIEDILAVSLNLDPNQIDQVSARRESLEKALPDLGEDREPFEDLRRFIKTSAYIEVLTVDPLLAPDNVKAFGVDAFLELLKKEELQLMDKYPDMFEAPEDGTPIKPEHKKALEIKRILAHLKEAYPEYMGVEDRIDASQKRFDSAGIKVGEDFKFIGAWPRGAEGQTFSVTKIDLFSDVVSGTLTGGQNPDQEWSVGIESLETEKSK